MTEREAIENLKYLIGEDCTDTQMDYEDEIKMGIQALEKQMSMPVSKTLDYWWLHICPNCKSEDIEFEDGYLCEYCPECGQHIDWSEEE